MRRQRMPRECVVLTKGSTMGPIQPLNFAESAVGLGARRHCLTRDQYPYCLFGAPSTLVHIIRAFFLIISALYALIRIIKYTYSHYQCPFSHYQCPYARLQCHGPHV